MTPYTGVIQASGLTLREMNELVNVRAQKWFVNPQIIVNLAKQRPIQIYLLGELQHPGLYSAGGSDAGSMMPDSGGGGSGSDGAGGSGSGDSSGGGGGNSGLSGMGGGQSTLTLSGALQLAGGLKDSADVRHLRVT